MKRSDRSMQTDERTPVRVVDLFAGPGGLGEGFAACHRYRPDEHSLKTSPFTMALSIEKDPHAVRTLQLRQLYRLLDERDRLDEYDAAVREWEAGRDPLGILRDRCPEESAEAAEHVKELTLGESNREEAIDAVRRATAGGPWVLLGGPPCQAYSLAGRSRNKGIEDYVPEEDARQTLYKEYLHVVAECKPDVFVLENVKGLLSASLSDRRIFTAMLEDLADPSRVLSTDTNGSADTPKYRLYSLTTGRPINVVRAEQQDLLAGASPGVESSDPTSCIVRMEKYGVPQARHRVLVLGIRTDVLTQVSDGELLPDLIRLADRDDGRESTKSVLDSLPELRSGLSREPDSRKAWVEALRSIDTSQWLDVSQSGSSELALDDVVDLIDRTLAEPEELPVHRGDRVVRAGSGEPTGESTAELSAEWQSWLQRDRLDYYPNHESRGHMREDLHRYLFAAAFAQLERRSPHLRDFPPALLPNHANVQRALEESGYFGDRFRVQVAHEPSRTVTSHISKDGHYYIHYNPSQCRSLTVREAARLQTFPDDYVFLGPRTEQYRQVGNAVPPYLSAQIALIVHRLLQQRDSGNG